MPRQVWVGNVPLHLTEGGVLLYMEEMGLPMPWKTVVRVGGGNRQTAFAILTFDDVDAAVLFLNWPGLRWANGAHMLVRRDIFVKEPPRAWGGRGGHQTKFELSRQHKANKQTNEQTDQRTTKRTKHISSNIIFKIK